MLDGPARPLSDFFRELAGKGRTGSHPLGRYIEAFASSDKRATAVIAAGGDSIVLRLSGGDVIHVTNKVVTPALGCRSFDLPIIEKGAIPSPGGQEVHYFIQPEAQTPVSERAMREFQRDIAEEGWMLSDRSQHQLGLYGGETKLLDPFAVERIPFWRPG